MSFRATEDGKIRLTEEALIRTYNATFVLTPAVLLEDGVSYVLLEDGSKVLLE